MLLLGAASVVLLVCVACLLSIVQWRKRSGKGKMPEGPAPLPIVGNILQVKPKNLAKTLEELSKKYGPVFSVQLGSTPVVVLSGYEVVKEALIDRVDEFAARGHMPIGDRANKGLGIIFSNNEGWLQVRRFALTTLRNFGMGKRSIEERIQEEAEHLLEEFTKTNGMPFDPTFKLSCAVSNVICSIVFGRRYDYKDKKFLSLMNNMNNVFEMMNSRWGQLYQMFSYILDYLPGPHNNIFKEIDAVKAFVAEEVNLHQASLDPSSPQDFIDCFLSKMHEEKDNPKSHFHMTNLITSTFDLFIAGTETTSTTTRYGLLLLLKYPKIQEKVQEEIDRVVGRSRRPCVADRTQMPYTDAVVHEIQRFITLIPTSLPHTVTKDIHFRDYIIPKGNEYVLERAWHVWRYSYSSPPSYRTSP
ncbi:cytochrome P450 2C9-like isoform X2 [Excalfactoria chinensis]|uniref:cytochrome P450 2C9-like isoform X2 n=1 Tax=Excalfactoria chinensis TaxID=46218 RepID=UPI003B3A5E92